MMWPINDIHKGEECLRNYLPGIGEDKQRSARLTAWFHTPKDYFIQVYIPFSQIMRTVDVMVAAGGINLHV
jgi:tubulin--tyrosine ligase-like protein 12